MGFKLLSLITIFCFASTSYAQSIARSSLNSFGNSVQKNGIRLTQTAGQSSNYSVFNSTELSIELRQGFQQTNNHLIHDKKGLQFILYPNPNHGSFSIQFDERIYGEIKYRLFDNQGRIYSENKLSTAGTHLFNFNLPAGSYILQLKDSIGKTGTTKIIIL
ncbi:T9SS type A sorting domain-containing protein [Brumimicrobium glaciale]|uniref:T9SS type A sorting domain-containing protein n=1 Tax=Brumimicrobium glaciale TaxID=200475 RepID=A0A4Q4KKN3_9FLAO|nr:T9SS type A sorting domain-containing protein [Brumimicrobium glaciale]RYM32379.1 T9SS type A sorting domain-containing protein [Brumimicrobium glaciale]